MDTNEDEDNSDTEELVTSDAQDEEESNNTDVQQDEEESNNSDVQLDEEESNNTDVQQDEEESNNSDVQQDEEESNNSDVQQDEEESNNSDVQLDEEESNSENTDIQSNEEESNNSDVQLDEEESNNENVQSNEEESNNENVQSNEEESNNENVQSNEEESNNEDVQLNEETNNINIQASNNQRQPLQIIQINFGDRNGTEPPRLVLLSINNQSASSNVAAPIIGDNQEINTRSSEEIQQNDVPQHQPDNDNNDVIIVEDNQSDNVADNEMEIVNQIQPLNEDRDNSNTPCSSKKRKRSKSKTPLKRGMSYDDENDDGTTCPICLDEWEMSGPHRLTSLKCGHLFGHSCIKRWLHECSASTRCCPSCKTRAQMRDLRFIYAKRICAVDKSEEYRLKNLLDIEKTISVQLTEQNKLLRLELGTTKNQLSKVELELEKLKCSRYVQSNTNGGSSKQGSRNYKLFMTNNIQITKEPGCRVMQYGKQSKNLYVSQKSNQNLFPGYGVRFIDVEEFRPMNFLHMSNKSIRDLSISLSEDLIVAATQESSAKVFNVHDRTIVSVFSPSSKPIWACAFDQDKFLLLGSQWGTTFLQDLRQPAKVLGEFRVENDLSPVINICPIPSTEDFPQGGILICKLQSIWFCEYTAEQTFTATKLNVDGPFVSLSYNISSNTFLISTRPSTKYSTSRYILGKIIKMYNVNVIKILGLFNGSKTTAVMSRCSQLVMDDTTLIASYLQDVKLLSIWDTERESRIQSLSISDTVFDTCPIVYDNETYLAALTESKCRIYKVNSSDRL